MSPIQKLEDSLRNTFVYVGSGTDAQYIAELVNDVRQNMCSPFELSAVVSEPGFPGNQQRAVGATISAVCVAHRAGYWLVYDQGRDEFLCFWGVSQERLTAPGIYGSALYCWSA